MKEKWKDVWDGWLNWVEAAVVRHSDNDVVMNAGWRQ